MNRSIGGVTIACIGAVLSMIAMSGPMAQTEDEQAQYEEFLAGRTPISKLDRSTPSQTVLGFAQSSTRSDYFTAYFYLSYEAKRGFMTSLMTGDIDHLFASAPSGSIALGTFGDQDMMLDLQIDGARVFDDVMFAAERDVLIPFGFGPGQEIASETILGGGLATVELVSGDEPSLLIFHLSQMSNGEWRIDLIGPENRRGGDRPWSITDNPITPANENRHAIVLLRTTVTLRYFDVHHSRQNRCRRAGDSRGDSRHGADRHAGGSRTGVVPGPGL